MSTIRRLYLHLFDIYSNEWVLINSYMCRNNWVQNLCHTTTEYLKIENCTYFFWIRHCNSFIVVVFFWSKILRFCMTYNYDNRTWNILGDTTLYNNSINKSRMIYYNSNLDRSFIILFNYRPPGGGRLFDMKVVSSYVFLRTYYV